MTLVLAVLLALATPFGTYVGDGVVTTVNGLINTSSKAVDEDQIDTMSDKWENKFSTFDKAGSVNGGSEEEQLAPGLYDGNGNMTMSWEELVAKNKNITNDCCVDLNAILTVDENGVLGKDLCYGYACCEVNPLSNYLEGHLVLDDSIKRIEDYIFYNCTSLTSITIPDSVTIIGCDAFYGCTSLTSITIPDSVTRIDYSVFSCCTNLPSINIPNSVTEIGESAFDGCNNLKTIYYNGIQDEWNDILFEMFWNYNCPQITVHCTDGDVIIPAYTE